MRIEPDLSDEEIIRCLKEAYGLDVVAISFLPIGADFNTFIYRITANNQNIYFLKLRAGEFLEASVCIPKYLAETGIKQVIPPIRTVTGQLWIKLASLKAILYPYVEGSNGIEKKLSDQQWIELGKTIKKLHSFEFPISLTRDIAREQFSSKWRETVKAFFKRIENEVYKEPVAEKMALFLKSKSAEIFKIIEQAEALAILIQKQRLEYVICHADIHGWNLIVDKEGAIYIVDWDTLIFAPKERDLMFISAGIWDSGRSPIEEELLFYQGYGQAEINYDAISYYRFERIIQDIAEYCEHVFLSDVSADDRMQSFEYLQSNFLPQGTIDRACHNDSLRFGRYYKLS